MAVECQTLDQKVVSSILGSVISKQCNTGFKVLDDFNHNCKRLTSAISGDKSSPGDSEVTGGLSNGNIADELE